MDYLEAVAMTRHGSWRAFEAWRRGPPAVGRLLLLTTGGDIPYTAFDYVEGDCLLLGRESAGVPQEVHAAADARLVIPMPGGLRSLNMAMAAAMALGEALRQTRPPTDKGGGSPA